MAVVVATMACFTCPKSKLAARSRDVQPNDKADACHKQFCFTCALLASFDNTRLFFVFCNQSALALDVSLP